MPRGGCASARWRDGAASPAASRAAMIRCTPRLSPSTTQAQPNPLTIVEGEQRVVRHAPGQSGVDVGALRPREREVLSLVTAADAVGGRARRVGEPSRVRRERGSSVRPASAIASSANARMLSSSRYRRPSEESSSSTITSERAARRPTTSIAAAAGTSSAARTDSTAGSGAPPANVASAHRPRWSSGNSRS